MVLADSDLTRIFLYLAMLLLIARCFGALAKAFGQPPVLGEILGGIALGPTGLSSLFPQLGQNLFLAPGAANMVVQGIISITLVWFLFLSGLEVQLSHIWRQSKAVSILTACSFFVPFLLGFSVALFFPEQIGWEGRVRALVFANFVGVALSISALPVLVKTLTDLGLHRTEFAALAVGTAALIDVLGWTLFIFILSAAGNYAAHEPTSSWRVGAALFLLLALFGIIFTCRQFSRSEPARSALQGHTLGYTLILALVAGALTQSLGLHGSVGAFVFGIVAGNGLWLNHREVEEGSRIVSSVFAPLFFVSIGLRHDLSAHFDLELVLLVTAIAFIGKFLGCWLANFSLRYSSSQLGMLAFALNSRGAMEIIIALLALEAGIISDRLFVAIVVMALATSITSGPGMKLFKRTFPLEG